MKISAAGMPRNKRNNIISSPGLFQAGPVALKCGGLCAPVCSGGQSGLDFARHV